MSRWWLLSALFLTGCVHHVPAPRPGTTVSFRNCTITGHSADWRELSCICHRMTWALDAKTHQTYALCAPESGK